MCPEVRGKKTAPSTLSSEYHIRRQHQGSPGPPGPERDSPIRRSNPGLDSGPLGWPLFRRSCIYIFWAGQRCIYVGRTVSGRGRPQQHFEKGWFARVTRIDIYATGSPSEIPRLECIAIHNFDPVKNKRRASKAKWTKKCTILQGSEDDREENCSKYLVNGDGGVKGRRRMGAAPRPVHDRVPTEPSLFQRKRVNVEVETPVRRGYAHRGRGHGEHVGT